MLANAFLPPDYSCSYTYSYVYSYSRSYSCFYSRTQIYPHKTDPSGQPRSGAGCFSAFHAFGKMPTYAGNVFPKVPILLSCTSSPTLRNGERAKDEDEGKDEGKGKTIAMRGKKGEENKYQNLQNL
jgi:hypothetical protein